MKFIFDNCISPRLAKAIHALVESEHEVVALRDRFRSDTPDTEWIGELGRQGGWIIISGDLRIRKRPQELAVWRTARLTTFFMASGFQSETQWEQARWMVGKWPEIVDLASRVAPGAAFRVPKRGKIEQV